uniref:DUF4337 domain-containing protein n=1 Tax=Bosea sp. NBC_00436 TaxID=2969620 RepID=A0A9E8CS72_9HYPH
MSEELANEHLEHAEHAEHAVAEGNSFLITVSATIAALAVVAAIIASLETVETSGAISEKNDAVLKQSQASDQWGYYQAKSLKQKMYEIAATAGGPKAADFEKEAQRYDAEQKEQEKQARELERQRDEKLAAGEKHENRHHGLTYAATLVHVGIAVATIAIITRGQRWPWYGSLLLGATGVAMAAWTYLRPLL